jgi:hypothetical protein
VALVDLKALSACTLLTVAWERTCRYFSFHITDTQDLLPGVGRLTLLQLYDGISERALRDPSKFTTYSYRSVTVPKLSFIEDWLSLLFVVVSFHLTLERFFVDEVVLATSTLMMRYL